MPTQIPPSSAAEEFLPEEEPYKEILNDREIARIADPMLRNIRQRYWKLRHEALLDEQRISDQVLADVWDQLIAREQAEILQYRKRKG